MIRNRLKASLKKATWSFFNMLPIILGMLLLTSLVMTAVGNKISTTLFTGHAMVDAFIADVIGSIAAGHPSAAYVLGGELLAAGVSIVAIVALIVSWVTVGIIQLPAEALLLGKRFALSRNLVNFFSALAVAFLTAFTLRLFQ